ncbi:MAG: hypothetical protein HYV54_00120 [Parcubacteria group bacterium]|nr:hypothetical protein [Parcubacteria group bacterium]
MDRLINKIKTHQDLLFLVAVIALVGLIGFGLGRLSSKYQTAELNIQSTLVNTAELDKIVTTPIEKSIAGKINSPPSENREVALPESNYKNNRKIIGNKNSKIYHYEDCPGALRMSEGNKVFFASVLEARNSGFRPAGNCPGLE